MLSVTLQTSRSMKPGIKSALNLYPHAYSNNLISDGRQAPYSLFSSLVASDLNVPLNPLPAIQPPHKISHDQDVMLFRVSSVDVLVLPHIDTLSPCSHLVMDDCLVIFADDVYPKFLCKYVRIRTDNNDVTIQFYDHKKPRNLQRMQLTRISPFFTSCGSL